MNELIPKRRPVKNRISITLQAAKIITLLKNLQKAKGVAGVYVTFKIRSHSQIVLTPLLLSLFTMGSALLTAAHCVKSVSIRSYSGLHFPALGLNTGKCEQK